MTDHESYEVLCTLAATCQLGAAERADFDEHCLRCPACRDQLRDLISIGAGLQFDAAIHATPASMPAGSLERFRARAIREGVAPRPKSTRSSPSYAPASAAAVFSIVVALVLAANGRRAAESFRPSAVAPISSRQSLSASVAGPTLIPQPSKVVHTRFARHGRLPADIEVNDATLTAQRFPHAITASYPFFGPQSAPKSSLTSYPALSRAQISRLDPFRNRGDSSSLSAAAIVAPDPPVDIASTGNGFDFAADIHRLHFRLPTAQ